MQYDPIRLELIKNGIGSVVDEMVLTIVRIAYSSILKDTMDISSAFCDRDGRMIAQGLSLPLHLGSFPDAMAAVRAQFGDDINGGDLILLNDPYHGGMHLPDLFLFKPVFIEGSLLGYAVVVAHHNDVGGRVPGSSAADSTEIFQEGLRIPPIKLMEAGVRNESVFRLIALNTRIPDIVMGDLAAQIAACDAAERGMTELVRYYGRAELETYFQHLLDYSEREARRVIGRIPDGTYCYTDYLDDDGVTPDSPVRISVAVQVAGDEVTVDFAGTSPQVAGAINATQSFAKSAVYFAVRAIMDSDAPNNAGFFRPIHVIAPEGSLVNPRPPAAVAARGVSGFRIIDAMFGALAQAVPDRVRAAGEGGITSYSLASWDDMGRVNLFREVVMGAWGGGAGRDGVDGVANPAANISNAPIELSENQAPILVERYEFVPDTGGAGQWRGGLAIERTIRFLGERGKLQLRSDRRTHRPYGLAGGHDGQGSANHLDDGQGWRLLPTKFVQNLGHDWSFRHVTAGAGGYGDPLQRDAELVLRDVRDGKVSLRAAREDYGVVLTENARGLDHAATDVLRHARSAASSPEHAA